MQALPLFVLLTACHAGGSTPLTTVDLLLTNARVITGTGTVVDRASILVNGGRIVDVRQDDPSPIAATRKIDVAGRTVLPGLIDTHVHLLIGDGDPQSGRMPLSDDALSAYLETALPTRMHEYLARGFTTVLSTGDYFPTIIDVRTRANKDPRSGPRVFVVGPVICAPDGHPVRTICRGNAWCRQRLAREVTTVTGAQAAVDEVASAGVDFVKIVHDGSLRSSLAAGLVQAVVETAHRRKLPAIFHIGSIAEAKETVTAGADRLAHPPSSDISAPPDLPQLMRGRGTASTLSISSISDGWEKAQGRPAHYLPNALANVSILNNAGGVVAFGTDVPMLSVPDAVTLELDLLRDAGLTPVEIIRAMTINAATYLGRADTIGTLEAGKIADLVIVGGDPLNDIAALRDVRLVLRDGEVVFSANASPF